MSDDDERISCVAHEEFFCTFEFYERIFRGSLSFTLEILPLLPLSISVLCGNSIHLSFLRLLILDSLMLIINSRVFNSFSRLLVCLCRR